MSCPYIYIHIYIIHANKKKLTLNCVYDERYEAYHAARLHFTCSHHCHGGYYGSSMLPCKQYSGLLHNIKKYALDMRCNQFIFLWIQGSVEQADFAALNGPPDFPNRTARTSSGDLMFSRTITSLVPGRENRMKDWAGAATNLHIWECACWVLGIIGRCA